MFARKINRKAVIKNTGSLGRIREHKFFPSACMSQAKKEHDHCSQAWNTIATNEDEIAEEVDNYYSNVLGTAPAWAHSINLEALQLPMRNLEHLEVPFSEEEEERVIKAMPLTKHTIRMGLLGDSTRHVGRSSRPI